MEIILCDRCGRTTKNSFAFFLVKHVKQEGLITFNSDIELEDKGIILCNNCLKDFDDFRYNHERFNKNLARECDS